jgi:hypothetical protein
MQYTRKVALVPVHMLKNDVPAPRITDNVKTKVLTEISKDMDDIMTNGNLTSEEKLNVHYQLLQRLRHHMKLNSKPISETEPQTIDEKPVTDTPESDIVNERKLFPPTEAILNAIRDKDKQKAEAILQAVINSNGLMGWTSDNKLTIRDQVIHDSDIRLLLKKYFGQHMNVQPPGYSQFQDGLDQLPGLQYLRSDQHSRTPKRPMQTRQSTLYARNKDTSASKKASAQKKRNQAGMGIFSEWKSFSQKH